MDLCDLSPGTKSAGVAAGEATDATEPLAGADETAPAAVMVWAGVPPTKRFPEMQSVVAVGGIGPPLPDVPQPGAKREVVSIQAR